MVYVRISHRGLCFRKPGIQGNRKADKYHSQPQIWHHDCIRRFHTCNHIKRTKANSIQKWQMRTIYGDDSQATNCTENFGRSPHTRVGKKETCTHTRIRVPSYFWVDKIHIVPCCFSFSFLLFFGGSRYCFGVLFRDGVDLPSTRRRTLFTQTTATELATQ